MACYMYLHTSSCECVGFTQRKKGEQANSNDLEEDAGLIEGPERHTVLGWSITIDSNERSAKGRDL